MLAALWFGALLSPAHGQTDGGAGVAYITPNDDVYAIQASADGRIVFGGRFTQAGSLACTGLARLKADGSVDTAFNPVITSPVNPLGKFGLQALAYDSGGNLLVGGQFTAVNGVARLNVARLKPDGTVDATFLSSVGTGLNTDVVRVIVPLADGTVLVGGTSPPRLAPPPATAWSG